MRVIKGVYYFLKEYGGLFIHKVRKTKIGNNYNEHKYYSYYNMMCEWMAITKKGKKLSEYIVKNGYKDIAVYGCGKIGKLAIDELVESGISVRYIIDKHITDNYKDINIVGIEDISQKSVDAIIISTTFDYIAVANELCDYTSARLVSLEDIIHDIYRIG